MAEDNEFSIEGKIANIKETLQRLGSSFSRDPPQQKSFNRDQSEYKTYMVKPDDDSPDSKSYENDFRSAQVEDDAYMRGSYSVGDIKDDSHENSSMFISPRFPTEDMPRPSYVSNYVIYGDKETQEQPSESPLGYLDISESFPTNTFGGNRRDNWDLPLESESKLAKQHDQVVQELEESQAALRSRDDECHRLRSRVAELEALNDRLEQDIQRYRRSNLSEEDTKQNQKDDINRLEANVKNLGREKIELETKVRTMENELSARPDSNQFKELNKSYDVLTKELKSRPNPRDVKHMEQKIQELENLLRQKRSRSGRRARSAERVREEPSILKSEKSRDMMKKDKDTHSMMTGKMPSYGALKEFTQKVFQILEVGTIYDIPPVLVKLKKSYKDFQVAKKFISCVSTIVVDCSPPSSYTRLPSLKAMWKWIRRLTEEYMALRRQMTSEQENKFIVLKLLENLGLQYPNDIHILRKRLEI